MNRQLPIIIAIGLSSAVLYASALNGIAVGVLMTYLAQLPLFIAGLAMGIKATAVAGTAGIIALAIIGGHEPGLIYALTTALPVTILVTLALRKRLWTDGQEDWYPPGKLLQGAAVWGGVLLVLAAIVFGSFGNGFHASVAAFVGSLSEGFRQATGQNAPPDALAGIADILPAIGALSWMLMATVNGLLAQMLVTRFGKNLRPGLHMDEIHVPLTWAGLIAAAAALKYVLPGDLGYTMANLAVVLAYPLLFQGLSVVHAAMASVGAWTIGYVAFYVTMLFFGWLALPVVALGLAEPVLKLRERLMRPNNT